MAASVRTYVDSDLGSIMELFGRSVREIASHDYDARQIAVWAPATPEPRAWEKRLGTGVVLVAECDAELSGFLRAEENGYLDLLYVHPRFKRQGIGSRLVLELAHIASRRNWPRLYTYASITARPFFEQHGFHMLRSQTVEREGVLLTTFHMERQ